MLLLNFLALLLFILHNASATTTTAYTADTISNVNAIPTVISVDLSGLHHNDLKALKTIIKATETGKQVFQHCHSLAGSYARFFSTDPSTGKTTINNIFLRMAISNIHDSETVEAHIVKYGEAILSLQSRSEVVEQGIAPCERVQAVMQHWDHAAVTARQDVVDCMKGAYALYNIILPAVKADDEMAVASLADISSDLDQSRKITAAAMALT